MATCPKCRTHYADDLTTCTQDGATLVPDATFAHVDKDVPAGAMIGEYQVAQKLGEGGFGTVYRAVHPVIGKSVAIKVLNRQFSANPEMVSRFIAEARAANQIRNRNIIDIFGFGALPDGRQYYVMELLEGVTLDRFLAQKVRLTPVEAIPILRGVARALDAAHAAGIVHRDLKPENIFLEIDEERGLFPKLLDFGIAKLLGESEINHRTRTGVPIGTPYYMSPEQCRGQKVDHRTDVYSFGIVVYQLLTGRVPFSGESYMDVMLRHASEAPARISEVCSDIPAELDLPVRRMLEKEPDKRPSSVSEAVEGLAHAAQRAGFPVEARSVPSGGSGLSSFTPAPAYTPAEMQSLASAETIQAPSAGTLENVATSAAPPSKGRNRVLYVVLAALLVGGGGAAAFVMTRPAPATERPVAAAALTEAPAPTPAPKPAEPSPGAVTVKPTPSKNVQLRVRSRPKDADVYLNGEKVATTPDVVKVPRGDQELEIEFRAPGFLPEKVKVTPNEDSLVEAKLKPERVARPRKQGSGTPSGDLEF